MKTKQSVKFVVGMALFAALGFVSGCVTAPSVQYQAPGGAAVAGYKTYVLVPFGPIEGVVGASPGTSLRYVPVITASIRNVLATKGCPEEPREQADFIVNVRTALAPPTESAAWGVGPAVAAESPNNDGALRIEIYDIGSKELMWVGWTKHASYRMPDDATLAKAIGEVLANFPPPPAKIN